MADFIFHFTPPPFSRPHLKCKIFHQPLASDSRSSATKPPENKKCVSVPNGRLHWDRVHLDQNPNWVTIGLLLSFTLKSMIASSSFIPAETKPKKATRRESNVGFKKSGCFYFGNQLF